MKFNKKEYTVKIIEHYEAKLFVEKYHYSGSAGNTSILCAGLFKKNNLELLGVSIWMCAPCGLAKKYSNKMNDILTLSRFAILPNMPTNTASFLLGQSIRILEKMQLYKMLITYADQRMNHTGVIYKATNWIYDGLTIPYYAWIDNNGKQISRYRTKSSTHDFMDKNYKRVGPYRKHKFIFYLKVKRKRQQTLF